MHPGGVARDAGRGVRGLHGVQGGCAFTPAQAAFEQGIVVYGPFRLVREHRDRET